jgi:hypothetical protein
MTLPPVRRVRLGAGVLACVICLAVYAYWVTGLRPFTAVCYAAVGVPIAVAGCILVLDGRGRRCAQPRIGEAIKLRRVLPWLLIALVATGLEGIGLALGGESASVPTLSTVIDHALAWHLVRMVMFCGWLLIGSVPVIRAIRGCGSRS